MIEQCQSKNVRCLALNDTLILPIIISLEIWPAGKMFWRMLLLKVLPHRAKHNLTNYPLSINVGSVLELVARRQGKKHLLVWQGEGSRSQSCLPKVWESLLGKKLHALLPFCRTDTDRRWPLLTRHQLYLKSLEVLSQPRNILVANTWLRRMNNRLWVLSSNTYSHFL